MTFGVPPFRLRAFVCVVAGLSLGAQAQGATFTVTKAADTSDGACNSDCSLREAVQAANADATGDEIVLPAGRMRVAIFGATEDGNATGDIDIARDVTIRGAAPHLTTIAATTDDRVLDVQSAGTDLLLVDVTIEGGRSPLDERGAGIRHPTDGELSLERVVVRGNVARGTATGYGGGLYKALGRLVLRDVAIVGNTALGNGYGGGVFVNALTTVVDMVNVTLASNTAGASGGGLYSNNAIVGTLTHVTVAGNEAQGSGALGGDLGQFRIRSSVVAGNTAVIASNCAPGFAPASDGGNVGDPACGLTLPSDAQTLDPQLEPLSAAFTVPVFVPQAGSPALDRAVGVCPATDARGVLRPQGAACDAGAAERPAPVATPAPPPPPAPIAIQPSPPTPRTIPRVVGLASVGRILRCRPASFVGATRTTVAWLRNGKPIRRATRITYRLARADRGRIVTCRSKAIGPGGTTSVVGIGVFVRQ